MKNAFSMSVQEAHSKWKSSELADEIWQYKNHGEPIEPENAEYKSWQNSIHHFLEAAVEAGLGNLEILFELRTPVNGYIDIVLIGSSLNRKIDESGRMLIVELKQWSSIKPIEDKDAVEISVGHNATDRRRHPISQICEYKTHMSNNHRGIYHNTRVCIDAIAYLHNFEEDRDVLFSSEYKVWMDYSDKLFTKEKVIGNNIVTYLKSTFSTERNPEISAIIDDCGYIMSEAGFVGLKKALAGEENAEMVKDQMPIVDYVRERLIAQKVNPENEIIVVSGGPGTGKTIVGMHFIYDYAEIFNRGENANGAVFCLPQSKTVKAVIDHELDEDEVPYLDFVDGNYNLFVVDEAHRMTALQDKLDKIFKEGKHLVILLQDDRQRILADEEGVFKKIKEYADKKQIRCHPLSLTIQKRCEALGALTGRLEEMFYQAQPAQAKLYRMNSIESVKVFDGLWDMETWIQEEANASRAKFVAPFCWKWSYDAPSIYIPKNRLGFKNGYQFRKKWNPNASAEQVKWYYKQNDIDRVASIYTSQGLEFENVAFIWWSDLKWDKKQKKWVVDLTQIEWNDFKKGVERAKLTQEEITTLVINTYYVMLTRAKKGMGIWFVDQDTKEYVTACLGLMPQVASAWPPVSPAKAPVKPQSTQGNAPAALVGTVDRVYHERGFGYIKGKDGKEYIVSETRYPEIVAPKQVLKIGNEVSFAIDFVSKVSKIYVRDVKPLKPQAAPPVMLAQAKEIKTEE